MTYETTWDKYLSLGVIESWRPRSHSWPRRPHFLPPNPLAGLYTLWLASHTFWVAFQTPWLALLTPRLANGPLGWPRRSWLALLKGHRLHHYNFVYYNSTKKLGTWNRWPNNASRLLFPNFCARSRQTRSLAFTRFYSPLLNTPALTQLQNRWRNDMRDSRLKTPDPRNKPKTRRTQRICKGKYVWNKLFSKCHSVIVYVCNNLKAAGLYRGENAWRICKAKYVWNESFA